MPVGYIKPSTRRDKKWMVHIQWLGGETRTIHFGAKGYQDYTTHGDSARQARYITRHRSREDWGRSGMRTAGFWSRWLLWNKRTLDQSKRDVAKRFGVTWRRGWPKQA